MKWGHRRPVIGADGTQAVRIWGKSGLCIGTMFIRSHVRPLAEEIAIVRRFLEKLNKDGREKMMTETFVNQVVLTGKIEKIRIEDDRFFALLNVGQDKWIPITAHVKDEKQRAGLLTDLAKFQTGDTIVLKGYVRAWSKETEGKWTNSLDIRILDLKPGTIPDRKPQASTQQAPAGW